MNSDRADGGESQGQRSGPEVSSVAEDCKVFERDGGLANLHSSVAQSQRQLSGSLIAPPICHYPFAISLTHYSPLIQQSGHQQTSC